MEEMEADTCPLVCFLFHKKSIPLYLGRHVDIGKVMETPIIPTAYKYVIWGQGYVRPYWVPAPRANTGHMLDAQQ